MQFSGQPPVSRAYLFGIKQGAARNAKEQKGI